MSPSIRGKVHYPFLNGYSFWNFSAFFFWRMTITTFSIFYFCDGHFDILLNINFLRFFIIFLLLIMRSICWRPTFVWSPKRPYHWKSGHTHTKKKYTIFHTFQLNLQQRTYLSRILLFLRTKKKSEFLFPRSMRHA